MCFGEVLFSSSLLVATLFHYMCFGEVLLLSSLPCRWCMVVSHIDVHILVPSTHHCHFASIATIVVPPHY
jgi:hypothetical protein